jgi:homoserine kinase type II
MNAITKLDVLDLETVLARYDIGELLRYWPAANGIENSNYFVRTLPTTGGDALEYVLTIREQPASAGTAYVPLLDLYSEFGLPVPAVIRSRNGQPADLLDGKTLLLSSRLPGRHVYNPTLKQVSALGRLIARLHLAASRVEFPLPDYPRDLAWLEHRAAGLRGYLPFGSKSLLTESLAKVASLLQRNDVARLPRGAIHGALFRDNVLFNELGLSGVLGFHHASNGYLIYDLAVAANDWCTDGNGSLDRDRAMALLRSYHALRPLHLHELWFFTGFALYAGLAFWLSRLTLARATDRSDTTARVRCNNPAEFERIVQQHSAHAFYVDPRLLG